MIEYRIEPGTAGWQICERKVAGAKAKEPGVARWAAVKFYSSLEQAALALLDLETAQQVTGAGTADLIAALGVAQAVVRAAVQDAVSAPQQAAGRVLAAG